MSDSNGSGKGDLLVRNARIIDGKGSVFEDLRSLRIEKGVITAIDRDIPGNGARVIDVAGATVLPGLMDTHVHLQSVPGSFIRGDDEETLHRLRFRHLNSYLACGVTTILDNAIASSVLREFQEYIDQGGVGPRIYALAPAFYPPDGYLANGFLTSAWGPHWRAAGTKEDIDALFREYEGLKNIVGTKTLIEYGFNPFSKWPIHTPEILKIIREESEKRNLPVHIHAMRLKEQKVALEMGVHTLAHPGFFTGSPSKEFIAELLRQGTYVTTTIASTIEQILVQYQPERLNEDLIRLAVPEEELKSAQDPDQWYAMSEFLFFGLMPKWMPDSLKTYLMKKVNITKMTHKQMRHCTAAILKMKEAGVPIVLGTDSANWPVFLNFFHGTSMLREMEIMGEAGMAPMDVIQSSTRIPAEMMGIDHLVGTVETGKRADLIVVREDPLKNLSALKKLEWVLRDGEARTPEEWMHGLN